MFKPKQAATTKLTRWLGRHIVLFSFLWGDFCVWNHFHRGGNCCSRFRRLNGRRRRRHLLSSRRSDDKWSRQDRCSNLFHCRDNFFGYCCCRCWRRRNNRFLWQKRCKNRRRRRRKLDHFDRDGCRYCNSRRSGVDNRCRWRMNKRHYGTVLVDWRIARSDRTLAARKNRHILD